MCGILGILGQLKDSDVEWMQTGSENLRHRGPDFEGFWIADNRNAIFAHRRLSIIDLNSTSNQPFISEGGDLILVFNGEIYNYIEIRNRLIDCGMRFKTQGDSEVLLASYIKWGVDCVKHFNGMFAFAIWDMRNGPGNEQLFIARDRCGEKPFYYRMEGKKFEFSSELKGLQKKDGLDLQAVNHYLALGYIPGDMCISSGVKKLPAGCAAIYDIKSSDFKIWKYWSLPVLTPSFGKEDGSALAEEIWNLLTDSVSLRLRSDVPTGIFLSGGLDSSLITAAARNKVARLKTFTMGVPGSVLDETQYASKIANEFETEHHILQVEKPSLDIIEDLKSYIDEPIADSSIIPSYLISRLTRQHVTVALGGDGGDELFGGYGYYQTILRDAARLGWVSQPLMAIIARIAEQLPAGVRGRNKLLSLRYGPALQNCWGTPYFDVNLRKKLLKADVLSALGTEICAPELLNISTVVNSTDLIDGLTRADFNQILTDDFLVKVDRASMANSLEVRTPYLDHRLIEFAFSQVSSDWKCTVSERRRIQNIMAKKYLPRDFDVKRKQGFSIPMNDWLRDIDAQQIIRQLPDSIFNHDFIEQLVLGQKRGRSNGARIFALKMLALSSAIKN